MAQAIAGVALAAMAAAPTAADAGGSARVKIVANHQSSQARVEWRDVDTVRIDFSGGGQPGQGYFLVRGQKTYMVADGHALPAGRMMGAHGNAPLMAGGRILSVKGPSGHKTIAGIRGGVYQVTVADSRGGQHTSTMVLTDKPLAREFMQAWTAMGRTMGGGRMDLSALNGKTGLLQATGSGGTMTVESLTAETPPASRFEVPPVMNMPGMPGMSGGMGR